MSERNGERSGEFEIGDAVYCLAGETILFALGVVADRAPLDAETLDGYDSSAFWRKGEAVNADALDGIDSSYFLTRAVASAVERVWWTRISAVIAVGGNYTFGHPLGRVPSFVTALAEAHGNANVLRAEATSTQITLYTGNGTALEAWVLLIG